MAYEKDGYTLHENKKNKNLRYFSKKKSTKGKPINLPDGYNVKVNKRTGLPYLKKK